MNCRETKALANAYVDRELDPGPISEIEQHLNGCKACSQAYENIRTLSSAVKSADLYFKAPAQLKSRIRPPLMKEDPARTAPNTKSRRPFWSQWLKWEFRSREPR